MGYHCSNSLFSVYYQAENTQDGNANMSLEPERNKMANERGTEEITVGPLLARAKLLRLRGQWDESISVCSEALRKYPDSITAHSLLGEIYETLGRMDDAAQWYAMAVERDPRNPQERAKLERTLSAQKAQRPPAPLLKAPPAPTKPPAEKTLEWFDRVFPPGRTDSIARLIFAVSGILAALLLLSAAIVFFVFRQNGGTAAASVAAANDILPTLVSAPEPVVVTPRATPVPTPAAESAPVASAPAVTSALARAASFRTAFLTSAAGDREEQFRAEIARTAGRSGVSIASVNFDAKGETIGVIVSLPARSEESIARKNRVVRAAAEVVRAAADWTRKYRWCASMSIWRPPQRPVMAAWKRLSAALPPCALKRTIPCAKSPAPTQTDWARMIWSINLTPPNGVPPAAVCRPSTKRETLKKAGAAFTPRPLFYFRIPAALPGRAKSHTPHTFPGKSHGPPAVNLPDAVLRLTRSAG